MSIKTSVTTIATIMSDQGFWYFVLNPCLKTRWRPFRWTNIYIYLYILCNQVILRLLNILLSFNLQLYGSFTVYLNTEIGIVLVTLFLLTTILQVQVIDWPSGHTDCSCSSAVKICNDLSQNAIYLKEQCPSNIAPNTRSQSWSTGVI